MALAGEARVPVDAVMTELHGRVRERLRAQLLASGGSPDFEDPALFADVEALLHAAAGTPDSAKLILPELLGEPDTWRLTTSMRYQSHRARGPAAVLIFLKRHILMPVFRWLYEVQPRQFRAPAAHQPGAVCVRAGAGARNRSAPPRNTAPVRRRQMKLAFVVQRYGADIAGGSEAHCRELAERLSARHDITVLTTCAKDYVTWENAYPAGAGSENGVHVIRFPVARQRRIKVFADLSDEVFDGGAPPDRQEEWFRENGPDTPALLEHLRAHGREYDLVLFWTYRYSPSYFGLPLVADRAVLVPTAEEDPAIDLDVLLEFFDKPAGYVFLTPEECELVSSRALHPLRHIGCRRHRPRAGAARRDVPRADRSARYSGGLSPLPRARRSQQGVRRAARELPGVRVDAHARHARARRAGEDAGAGASADPRARLRVRRGALGAPCPCTRAGRARRGTKASASCCSRRGTTPFRRWSTAAARCSQARSRAPTAACTTCFPPNSTRRPTTC